MKTILTLVIICAIGVAAYGFFSVKTAVENYRATSTALLTSLEQ